MKEHRTTCILYTAATCNLNCRYCYIDKNPALVSIDKILEKSFEGDYYINFMKEMFFKDNLTKIETWGGEPYLAMHRFYDTLDKAIQYFPNLNTVHSSTNFVATNWFDEFYGLLQIFDKYPNREFTYELQLSLDGDEEINDYGRGKETTKKFIKNFDYLMKTIGDKLPSNVKLIMWLKPTLDQQSIRLLDTKERIIKYYQFLEQFPLKVQELNYNNIIMGHGKPNTACPSQHTVEDGKLFAELLKMCREIEKENKTEGYFKLYEDITPFSYYNNEEDITYKKFSYTCGSGRHHVGLLPNNMISTCHNGFVDMLSDYKKFAMEDKNRESSIDFEIFLNNQPSKFTLNMEQFKQFEKQVELGCNHNCTAQTGNITALIQTLAFVNQVDSKYQDEREALKATLFLKNYTSFCMRDNHNVTGSIHMYPIGLIRLLLNGAKEIITNEQ